MVRSKQGRVCSSQRLQSKLSLCLQGADWQEVIAEDAQHTVGAQFEIQFSNSISLGLGEELGHRNIT